MTRLVQVAVAGDVAEAEQLQELLTAAGIESQLEPAVEHDPDVLDDPPLKVLVVRVRGRRRPRRDRGAERGRRRSEL